MDRLAVLARHLGAGGSDAQGTTTLVPSPTAAASSLGAFCPHALHRFITPDNFELRQAIKAFLKVRVFRCCAT